MNEENSGRLQLARMEKNSHWLIAAMAGLTFGWIAFLLAKALFPSQDGTLATAIAPALLISVFSALYFGGQSSLVALELSKPPILVKTRIWFGWYQRETRTPLDNVAWVRVIFADDCLLSIEAGTHTHQTTSMVCIPYSIENIAVAERLCTEISEALRVADKGFLAFSI